MKPLLAAIISLAVAGPAVAGLTERELAGVSFAPPSGARVPVSLKFQDRENSKVTLGEALDGRPGLLIPVDYTCRSVCGPALSIAAAALTQTGLSAGRDYRLIVVGIDPKDNLKDARALTEARVGDPALIASASILTGDAGTVQAFTTALGYNAVFDAETDQFAHSSGAVTLGRDGSVGRVLSVLALNPQDLRLALVEAGEGRIGGLGDRLALLCYGFDPVHGVYTPAIRRILQAASVVMVGVLALALLTLHRRSRRAGRPREGVS